jgi:orotate phosphoribosyltransferase
VQDCFVVFYYNIFPESGRILAEHSLSLHYLATWWDVLDFARSNGVYDGESLSEIESYLNQPSVWSAAHGGLAEFGAEKASI